jgi:xylulokinase
MVDENGVPLRRSIQQNDARALAQIKEISGILDQETLYRRTGGTTNQQHILPRLLWVKQHETETFAKTKMILGSYDFIAYKLTGSPSLEINWAAESGSFDIHSGQWIQEDLNRFGIDPALLPPVRRSQEISGLTRSGLEKETGLPPGIPVIAGSADHVASTLAAGIVMPGDLLIKFGGAGDILFSTDKLITNRQLFFDYHVIEGQYLLNGCMAASGSLVKWFVKDILGDESPEVFSRLDQAAASVHPASDGLIILPYFLGEKTPLFDPTARGVLFGLTLSHQKAHIFRAILEAVIYGFKHHIQVLAEGGAVPEHIYATNGGAKSSFWCQIASDVLDADICSYPSHPGSALGVAFLAGKAAGIFSSWEDIKIFLKDKRLYHPESKAVTIYDAAYKIYRDLYTQLRPSFDATQHLSALYDTYKGGLHAACE